MSARRFAPFQQFRLSRAGALADKLKGGGAAVLTSEGEA
jgi:hypothetical protein